MLQPIERDDPNKPNVRIVDVRLGAKSAGIIAARNRGAYVKRMYATK